MGNLEAIRALPKADHTERAAAGTRDAETDAMKAEAPLLELICNDTGERGRKSGRRIDFHKCPVCGHHDDFHYYPDQNTWDCLSASNTTGIKGGSYIDYLLATGRATDNVDAMHKLREATGRTLEAGEARAQKVVTPPWVPVRATKPPKLQPPLVDNLIRRGHIALMSGKGKSGKTFSAIELALALAVGGEWFGHSCAKGRTLFIDPECKPEEFHDRVWKVCKAMNIDPRIADANIDYWNLRGKTSRIKIPQIIGTIASAGTDASLIVIDSVSLFVQGDENNSVDVHNLTDLINDLSMQTDAAILLIHHYGKGLAGDRDAGDRARGSSVWLDAPDHVFTLTEIHPPSGEASDYLEGESVALSFEVAGQRTFKKEGPTHIIWRYPVHHVDDDGITADWKPKSSQRTGAKATNDIKRAKAETARARIVSKLLAHFYAENIGEEGLLMSEAATVCGCDARTIMAAVDGCDFLYVKEKSSRKRYVRPTRPPLKLEFQGKDD